MSIQFLGKDQIWADGITVYWFDVDGKNWGISDQAGELTLLDYEAYPVEECNDHDNIKELLIPEYEKRIDE